MAVWGLQADYDENQGKGVQLYLPGKTQLKAGDIFLGGAGTGITDSILNGAQRLWGADRQATAKAYDDYLAGQNSLKGENQNLLSQLNSAQKQVKASTAKNPMMALIGDDPESMAMYKQAQQAAKLGGRNAMEELNARGILNSTVTGDRVAQIGSEAMTNVSAQIMALQAQKRQQALSDAYNRMNTLGYVDNTASTVLGLPVGTPTAQAKQALFEQEMAQKNFGLNEGQLMGTYNGQQTLNAQQLAQQKAQQEWENAFNEKQMAADQAYKAASLARSGNGSRSGSLTVGQQADNATGQIMDYLNRWANGTALDDAGNRKPRATANEITQWLQDNAGIITSGGADFNAISKWAGDTFTWNPAEGTTWNTNTWQWAPAPEPTQENDPWWHFW